MNMRTQPDFRQSAPLALRFGLLLCLISVGAGAVLAPVNVFFCLLMVACGEIVWWMCWQNGRYHQRARQALLFTNTLLVFAFFFIIGLLLWVQEWIAAALIGLLTLHRLLIGFEREDKVTCFVSILLAFVVNVAVSAGVCMLVLQMPGILGSEFQWLALALLIDFALSYLGAVMIEQAFRYSLVNPYFMRLLAIVSGLLIGYAALLAGTVGESMMLGAYLGLKAILCIYLGFAQYSIREESYYSHARSKQE